MQVIRDNGETLPTYALKDRFYVQGNANERYIIRITNPTPNRVEAVVTVDGLDVVDGENGDLRKRGYVVPPYGETRIEGFRTSSADVATFRFSAVSDSYAGKKGKARNVGVIAVALFEEEAAQQIIQPEIVQPNYRQPYDYEDDLDVSSVDRRPGRNKNVAKVDKAPAPRKDSWGGESAGGRGGMDAKRSVAPADSSPAPTTTGTATRMAPPPASPPRGYGGATAQRKSFDDDGAADEAEEMAPRNYERQQSRPGLGTEFGEQRSSAATFTKFVRAAGRPIAIAELRYNDAAGLTALGILVSPLPDEGEIMTRETADPFPGDGRFARAPR